MQSLRKEREVENLRKLWAVESPGHPNAASLSEHYGAMLARLIRVSVLQRRELNYEGLLLVAMCKAAMRREL